MRHLKWGPERKDPLTIARHDLEYRHLTFDYLFTCQVPEKRRKVATPTGVSSARAKGKERAFERTTIEVPRGNRDSEDSELDDENLGVIEEFGAGVSFLQTLDEKGISRCVLLHLNDDKGTDSVLGVSGSRIVYIA